MAEKSGNRNTLRLIKGILLIILILLVIIFVIQNTEVVEVKFLAWKVSTSRALMLFGTFFAGIIVGWLLKRMRPKQGS